MTAKVYCWKKMYKKGVSGTFWIIVAVIVLLLITSTQKIAINDKQLATASITSCGLINQVYDPVIYDPVNRVCIPNKQKQNETTT